MYEYYVVQLELYSLINQLIQVIIKHGHFRHGISLGIIKRSSRINPILLETYCDIHFLVYFQAHMFHMDNDRNREVPSWVYGVFNLPRFVLFLWLEFFEGNLPFKKVNPSIFCLFYFPLVIPQDVPKSNYYKSYVNCWSFGEIPPNPSCNAVCVCVIDEGWSIRGNPPALLS